jgi:myo-inositol-1(or 4)-monophosphatase
MPDFMETCERAARQAGQLLLSLQHQVQVREKGPKDLVTEADLAAQDMVRSVVLGSFPDHGFLGEETEAGAQAESAGATPYRWIVDPLDGTVNYVHGLPSFAVSVALEHQGRVVAGVVFDPGLDECFRAEAGRGAALNGRPIRPSGCRELREALVAASFSANVARDSIEVARFLEGLQATQSLRRLGSAALNLCYVAAGRLDGYWASSVKAWDVAAGALIVREAGAHLTGIDGSPFELHNPHLLCAAGPILHGQLQQMLAAAA